MMGLRQKNIKTSEIHDPTQWIYQTCPENKNRYSFGIKGSNPLICIGINPSTAAPSMLDNTTKSVQRLAFYNNFDSWIMLNVYPERATLLRSLDMQLNSATHKSNLKVIEGIFKYSPNKTVWAAWGTLIMSRDYFISCLKDIYNISLNHQSKWISLGNISKHGHPHHPLYLKSTLTPRVFDMEKYMKNLIMWTKK